MRTLISSTFALFLTVLAYAQAPTNANAEALKDKYNRQITKQTTTVFEENKGQMKDQHWQARPDVLYYGNSEGMNYYIRNNGMSYQLSRVVSWKKEDDKLKTPLNDKKEKRKVPDQIGTYRVDAEWQNHNSNFTVEKGMVLGGYNNYYNVPEGVEPALFVKQYESVTLKNVWNGIDVHYYSANGFLETDYLVAPGANYKQIQIAIKGAELSTDNEGNLTMKTPFGEIREGKLKVYQNNELLEAKWLITPLSSGSTMEGLISFQIANYNPDLAIRIDPLVSVLGATYYGGTGDENGLGNAIDANSNIYLCGSTYSPNNISSGGYQNVYSGNGQMDAYLVKFNSNGGREWGTYYGSSQADVGWSCTTGGSGNVYLAGQTGSTTGIASSGHQNVYGGGAGDGFLVKFNTNGIRQWATYYGGSGSDFGYSCSSDLNENIYLSGNTSSNDSISSNGHQNTLGSANGDAFLVKFNSNGIRQWGTYYGGSNVEFGHQCTTDNLGNVYLCGSTQSSNAISANGHQNNLSGPGVNYDAYLVKFNTNGVRMWGTYYGGGGSEFSTVGVCSDNIGNIYLTGSTLSSDSIAFNGFQNLQGGGGKNDAFLVKFNTNGVRQWGTYYGGDGDDYSNSCFVDMAGNVYIAGGTQSDTGISVRGPQISRSDSSDAFLVRFNSSGMRIWGTYYGGNGIDNARSGIVDSNGDIYLTGITSSVNGIASNWHQNIFGGERDAFIVKLKQSKNVGTAWHDFNGNCVKENNEISMPDGTRILIQPGNYITQTKDGFWSIDSLPTGTYTATADTFNRNWLLTCPVSQSFTVNNGAGLTNAPNFGYKSRFACPKPLVSVIMPRMRRGFGNQIIYIQACNLNNATDILNNAYVDLDLPSSISVQSGSLTYTSVGGNKYRVNIGTLYPGQCVNFTFNATVSTSAAANQTLCLSAELFPQANCVFDSIPTPYQPGSPVSPCLLPYDNSLLVVRATCANDSVRLVVKNVAPAPAGNMVCYSPVRIYLDGILYFQDSVKLNGGDSVIYVFAGGNQTWHIEADNHPLNYRANPTQSTFIELCGTGNWTPGIANTLPQPDALPVTDIYCGQVTAPLDPNDKTGFPLGVGATHDILRNKEIEYLIRFQNVGTDTAVNVVIRDTLTTDLDIFSVRSGVSSHPYDFNMYGQRVLEWKFNNIMLPDSNTNEPASNGFVKFMVKQNKDLPYGTVIENTAAIYFDFEAPVITNTYFHTVSPPQQVVSGIAAISVDNMKVLVAPNPMQKTATVTIENFENKSGAEWQLYDLSGRIAHKPVKFTGNQLIIKRNDLEAGLYLYRIVQQEKTIANGRLVFE